MCCTSLSRYRNFAPTIQHCLRDDVGLAGIYRRLLPPRTFPEDLERFLNVVINN